MKKFVNIILLAVLFLGISVISVNAQMMMGGFSNSSADWDEVVEHTLREEKEGKELWDKFSRSQDRGSSTESGQAKEVACADLGDEQFGVLGEYFMGQMLGDAHPAMNEMMTRMMDEEGEEQMHVVMGKRLSGCDASASYSSQSIGFMPMMQMMGGWSSPFGFNSTNNMMNLGFGFFGWIFMIFWWALIIAGIVALIKWLSNQNRGGGSKSAPDILKERYARGEIDKKEFEEKKKDLA